jgi:hypothetical protein
MLSYIGKVIREKPVTATGNSGNSYLRERLSTVDLLNKVSCFVKKKNTV